MYTTPRTLITLPKQAEQVPLKPPGSHRVGWHERPTCSDRKGPLQKMSPHEREPLYIYNINIEHQSDGNGNKVGERM
jgi:hypothetical protein